MQNLILGLLGLLALYFFFNQKEGFWGWRRRPYWKRYRYGHYGLHPYRYPHAYHPYYPYGYGYFPYYGRRYYNVWW